ncbi:MAG: adenylyltransferase/cytidyltransferase family protein [Meiothermus sp.]|nr:adenylyltransferase/cytidyltransferase family protein [Meiothermus sp.]
MTLGLYIGRFQPFHNAHLGIALESLRQCDKLLFVLGSAQQSRTRKNPFTVEERSSMIRASLEGAGVSPERILFAGIEDHPDDAVWCQRVKAAAARYSPKPVLFGAEKDDSAYYLRIFPEWELRIFPVQISMSATEIRQRYFAGQVFEHMVQGGASSFLHQFAQTADFAALKAVQT